MPQTTGFNLPVPQSPFVDAKTGTLTYDGYQYLLSLLQEAANSQATATVATGLTAKGTTQATALLLTNEWNEVTSVTIVGPEVGGVLLQALQPGQSQTVFNPSSATFNVYPPPGAQIDALGVNAPYSVTTTRVTFDFITTTQISS